MRLQRLIVYGLILRHELAPGAGSDLTRSTKVALLGSPLADIRVISRAP